MKHKHLIAFLQLEHVANCCLMMFWCIVYVWFISGICNELSLYLCKYVLVEIYGFKLDLEVFVIGVEIGIYVFFQTSFINSVLNDFLWNSFSSEKQRNASSRSWYHASRSWEVLHEQSSVRLDSARQFGLLTVSYHDHDIVPHDRDCAHDRSSRSWQFARQALSCSRPLLTIMTTHFELVTLKKKIVSNWFIFYLFWGFF